MPATAVCAVAGVAAGAAVGAAVGAAAEACAAEADWLPQAVRASAAVRVRASIVIFFFIWVISFVLASAFVGSIRGGLPKTGVAGTFLFCFFSSLPGFNPYTHRLRKTGWGKRGKPKKFLEFRGKIWCAFGALKSAGNLPPIFLSAQRDPPYLNSELYAPPLSRPHRHHLPNHRHPNHRHPNHRHHRHRRPIAGPVWEGVLAQGWAQA